MVLVESTFLGKVEFREEKMERRQGGGKTRNQKGSDRTLEKGRDALEKWTKTIQLMLGYSLSQFS